MPADPARRIERNSPEAEEAYANAPDGLKVELIRGMVCMAPAPVPLHQRLVQRVCARVTSAYDRTDGDGSGPGGWVIITEPELHLGERPDKSKPDLAGWRVGRATFSLSDAAITIAPDWICEVLSPSTETYDRGTKAPVFAEHGVEWLWLIDPESRTVEVFRNQAGTFRPARATDTKSAGLPPFGAASMDRLFESASLGAVTPLRG